MKLRITQKQLDELTLEQKQNLCDLWIPNLYDAAVATVCVDAAEEKYGQITFVIGGITISKKNYNMTLYDLKFLPEEKIKIIGEDEDLEDEESGSIDQNDEIENEENQDIDENYEANEEEEFSFDEDFSFEFQRPESYSKHECLPLLTIGQMIDILSRKNFGECNFNLSVEANEDYIFEMGNNNFISESSYNADENRELCDVLWEAVKTLL